MANPVFDLIFKAILRIPDTVISNYPLLQDQLLYLILLPHIILFIFIYWFIKAVMPEHRGLRSLLGVGVYAFLILSGWYGSPLISIFVVWWQVLLIAALIFFIGSKFIKPGAMSELLQFSKGVGKKITEKSKEIKDLERERDVIREQLTQLPAHPPPGSMEAYQRNMLQMKLVEVEKKLSEL